MRVMMGSLIRGQGLAHKALRGSALTMFSFGGMQAIRLASNLILTRLLYPEVFGLMSLIMVIIQGLVVVMRTELRAERHATEGLLIELIKG